MKRETKIILLNHENNQKKEVRAVHYGNASSPLIEISYHNESREILVNQQNIPTLIAMLQSINSEIKKPLQVIKK